MILCLLFESAHQKKTVLYRCSLLVARCSLLVARCSLLVKNNSFVPHICQHPFENICSLIIINYFSMSTYEHLKRFFEIFLKIFSAAYKFHVFICKKTQNKGKSLVLHNINIINAFLYLLYLTAIFLLILIIIDSYKKNLSAVFSKLSCIVLCMYLIYCSIRILVPF